uniref:Uncharacterized protein n=1 Tax=Arundo donax TaxID=35708 RepID=A0A0A9GZL7_ARUDO
MAARPSHTPAAPPPCFALCSHRMESDVAALEETRLLLEVTCSTDAWLDMQLKDGGREEAAAAAGTVSGDERRTEEKAMRRSRFLSLFLLLLLLLCF